VTDEVDYRTLETLWERYDERPSRISAIRVRPENLVTIARSLAARGIRANVDFKDHTISFEAGDDGALTARAHHGDYIVTAGDGLDVVPSAVFRRNWRKFMNEEDW
jgi:hypothetical protein